MPKRFCQQMLLVVMKITDAVKLPWGKFTLLGLGGGGGVPPKCLHDGFFLFFFCIARKYYTKKQV